MEDNHYSGFPNYSHSTSTPPDPSNVLHERRENFYWVDGTPYTFQNWNTLEPNSTGTTLKFIVMEWTIQMILVMVGCGMTIQVKQEKQYLNTRYRPQSS